MNDRYLFKAKRIDNGEWVEGFYVGNKKEYTKLNSLIFTDIDTPFPENFDFCEIDEKTLCQCTGLTDKNGKRIWENDICDRKEPFPEIVRYREGDWTLDYSYASKNEYGFNFCNLGFYVCVRNCVEVIGNIFDNPELLEGEKDAVN